MIRNVSLAMRIVLYVPMMEMVDKNVEVALKDSDLTNRITNAKIALKKQALWHAEYAMMERAPNVKVVLF